MRRRLARKLERKRRHQEAETKRALREHKITPYLLSLRERRAKAMQQQLTFPAFSKN
jgi:hypothetical protein